MMLEKFVKYFSVYRPLNLLLIAAAQMLAGYYLFLEADLGTIFGLKIHWFVLGTIYTASFGYWINDFYDQERDLLNQKKRGGTAIYPIWFVFFHFFLFATLAIYCGYIISPFFMWFFIFSLIGLWLYSFKLKDLPLYGNIIIGVYSFLSIYALKWLMPSINLQLIIHFALMAGLLNFAREIVKDSEDIEGDKLVGSRTYPIVYGQDANKKIANLVVVFVLSFIIISVYYQHFYFKLNLKLVYIGYYLFFVAYPLYYFIIKLYEAQKKEHFHRLSQILKYVLYTGILSILFF